MTRDNGEQSTRPDAIDFDSIASDGESNHHSEPSIIPDHGAQPRLPERPSKDTYDDDRHNLYRPADDPFLRSLHEAERPRDDRQFTRQRWISRLLKNSARSHAPRLAWRDDAAIAEVLEREVLPDARIIVSSLTADIRSGVIDKYVEIIWDEIGLIRRNRRSSLTRDRRQKKAT